MAASLTLSAYFENGCALKVPWQEPRLYICEPIDYPGKTLMPSGGRFIQILNHSVADMDDDETLLSNKDRVQILTENDPKLSANASLLSHESPGDKYPQQVFLPHFQA